MSAIQIIRPMVLSLGALLLAQAALLDVSAQTVYKTVDEQGNVIYTDRPPANAPANVQIETVAGLDISRSDRGEITSRNEESRQQAAADNAAASVRAGQDAEKAGEEAAHQEARAANCVLAKQQVTKYSEAHRLYRDMGNGEREYLSDAELDAERSKSVRSVSEWCD